MAARQITPQQAAYDTVYRLIHTGTLTRAIDKEVITFFRELLDLREEAQFSVLHQALFARAGIDQVLGLYTNFYMAHETIFEDVAKTLSLLRVTFESASMEVDQDTKARCTLHRSKCDTMLKERATEHRPCLDLQIRVLSWLPFWSPVAVFILCLVAFRLAFLQDERAILVFVVAYILSEHVAPSLEATARLLQTVKVSTRKLHASLDIYWQGCTALSEFLLVAPNIGPNEEQKRSDACLFIKRFQLNFASHPPNAVDFRFVIDAFYNGFLVLPDQRTSSTADPSKSPADTSLLSGINESPEAESDVEKGLK